MTEKQISVRISAVGGDKLQAQLKGIGAEGQRAFQQVGNSAGQSRAALQNTAFQVQDVFVQVASGTDISRALSQQLPQLLSGFGLMGVLAGTASAALIPLVSSLLSSGESAESAEKAIGAFTSSLSDYRASLSLAYASTSELQKEFGLFANEIQRSAKIVSGVQLSTSLDEAKATIEPLKAGIAEVIAAFENLRQAQTYVTTIPSDNAEAYLRAQEAVGIYQDSLDSAAESAGVLPEKALELATALDQIGKSGLSDIPGQAGAALSIIESLADESGEIPEPLRNAAVALGEMSQESAAAAEQMLDVTNQSESARQTIDAISGSLDAATGRAQGLAAQMGVVAANAYNAALSIADAINKYGALNVIPGTDIPRGTYNPAGMDGAARDSLRETTPNPYGTIAGGAGGIRRPVSGGGGGGGTNEALKEQNDLMREAERVIEATRTAQEEYNDELAKLDTLLSKNLISQDVYDRALKDLQSSLKDTIDVAGTLKSGIGDVASGLIEAGVAGKGFEEAVGTAIANVAIQLAESQLNAALMQVAQLLFPNVFGAAAAPVAPTVPSFDGGGYTGGGARSGGLDGKGGFAAMLHPNETIIDHNKRQARAGGGNVTIIVENHSGAEVTTTETTQPNGDKQIRMLVKKIVGEAIQGGELDRVMGASYGLKRQGR